MGYKFRSRYARKPIKGSKDSDGHLVPPKKLEPKNWLIDLASRARWSWPKRRKNTPTCGVHHREPQTQNEKMFFQSCLEDMLYP